MPNLIPSFNWGTALQNDNPELTRQLSQSYSNTAFIVNTKVSKYVTEGADPPASSDLNRSFEIGDIYVRKDTDSAWILTSRTTDTNVTWTIIT